MIKRNKEAVLKWDRRTRLIGYLGFAGMFGPIVTTSLGMLFTTHDAAFLFAGLGVAIPSSLVKVASINEQLGFYCNFSYWNSDQERYDLDELQTSIDLQQSRDESKEIDLSSLWGCKERNSHALEKSQDLRLFGGGIESGSHDKKQDTEMVQGE